MKSINTSRVIVFKTLAEALASKRVFGYEEVAVIKGDNTKFKRGDGERYSGTSPAAFVGSTFAQLPWSYTSAAKWIAPTADQKLAVNVTATLTAAQLLAAQYITSTSAAAVSATLPTATLLGAAIGATQGSEYDFTVDNSGGANAVTLVVATGIVAATPALTGGGSLVVASGSFGKFKIIFKSATTALIFRVL